MKLDWQTWAGKIDDLKLRERALIFAMAALILVTLVNVLLLEPLFARQKSLSQQVTQQQDQLKTIQVQIQAAVEARGRDPGAVNLRRLETLRSQLAQLDSFVQGKRERLIPPDKMAEQLEQILRHNRQLQLIELQTLPVTTLAGDAGSAEQGEREIYKHGVQITVRGNYLELLGYVSELERLPRQMLWSNAQLKVEHYPDARLTLTLYTLSFDKTWLVV
ncbi:MAG: type II secretion system protein GspM [Burkholderiales bacterium]